MIQPNYQIMTVEELRQYILKHRDDEDAVHEMVLRLQSEGKTGTTEDFLESVKQKLQSQH
jgi:hypothetical protein